MILKTVDSPNLMWSMYDDDPDRCVTDLFLTTTSATISRRTGKLVMGKGHALQVKQRIGRNIESVLAKSIEAAVMERVMAGQWKDIYRDIDPNWRVYGDYYLLVSQNWPDVRIGLFQTKRFFKDSAGAVDERSGGYEYSIKNMVHWSTLALIEWCREHPDKRVDMPFPGIGAGGCSVDEIMPIIERLPDTVYVWKLEE